MSCIAQRCLSMRLLRHSHQPLVTLCVAGAIDTSPYQSPRKASRHHSHQLPSTATAKDASNHQGRRSPPWLRKMKAITRAAATIIMVDAVVVLESEVSVDGRLREVAPLPLDDEVFAGWPAEKRRPVLVHHVVRAAEISNLDNSSKDYSARAAIDSHWLEAYQRRRMVSALLDNGLTDGNVFVIGDLDEIPHRAVMQLLRGCKGAPTHLALEMRRHLYGFGTIEPGSKSSHAVARTYSSRVETDWAAHHQILGNTVLADAGWHCSWSAPSHSLHSPARPFGSV